MTGGAEGDALLALLDVGPLGVIGRDEPRDVDEDARGRRLSGQGTQMCAHDTPKAVLFTMISSMSSCQDLTNDSAPSFWSLCASASISMRASAYARKTASQSPPSSGIAPPTRPLSANASRVFSGIVLTVSGAASPST